VVSSWRRQNSQDSRANRKVGLPKAIVGPFQVDLLYQDGKLLDGRHVTFCIRVRDSIDGEHLVHQRYSSFARLRNDIVQGMFPLDSELPMLPPKGFLKKRWLWTRSQFMDNRLRRLGQFLRDAARSDCYADNPAFRRFLGVDSSETRLALVTASAITSEDESDWRDESSDGDEMLDTADVDAPSEECRQSGSLVTKRTMKMSHVRCLDHRSLACLL